MPFATKYWYIFCGKWQAMLTKQIPRNWELWSSIDSYMLSKFNKINRATMLYIDNMMHVKSFSSVSSPTTCNNNVFSSLDSTWKNRRKVKWNGFFICSLNRYEKSSFMFNKQSGHMIWYYHFTFVSIQLQIVLFINFHLSKTKQFLEACTANKGY